MCKRCGNPWRENTYLKRINSLELAVGDAGLDDRMEKREPQEVESREKKSEDVKVDNNEENCNFYHKEKIEALETCNNNKEDSIKKLKEVIESLYIKLDEKEDSIERLQAVIKSLFIKLDKKEDIIKTLREANELPKDNKIEGDNGNVSKPIKELESVPKKDFGSDRNVSIQRSVKRKACVEKDGEDISPTKIVKIFDVLELPKGNKEKKENKKTVIGQLEPPKEDENEKAGIHDHSNSDTEVVYWDLETTGLNKDQKHVDIEIVEIGAISESTGENFKQYILPTTPIKLNASSAHGIHLKMHPTGGYDMTSLYVKENGRLVKVDAVDKRTGLKMFLDWLKKFNKKILLAGYNNHRFDDWVLSHNLLHVDLDASELNIRFGDVAKMVRPVLRKQFHPDKWSLTFAVTCLLRRGQTSAHGALSDTEDARDLLIKLAKEQRTTTKEILEKTAGEKDDSLRAIKDFDEVMKVCVKMFLTSGLYLVSGGRKPMEDDA